MQLPLNHSLRRDILRWAGAAPLASAFGGLAFAQDARPTKLVVPFPAGGATDAIARLAAESMSTAMGAPVLVDNRGGAAGGIAAELVSRAAPDGHTLLVAGQGLLFINKALYKKLSYDPDADYVFVGMLGSFPNVVVVHPDVPAQTISELMALARARPGQISYGSNGVGSLAHLSTEVMAATAKVKFLHVPYQGAAPQMTDLLSGRINFSLIASQTVVPMIREKRLRALAVSTGTRFADLPGVPTLVESGFPALDAPVWFAVMAPAATPAPVLAKLRSTLAGIVSTPAYASELAKKSALPMPMSVEASGSLFTREKALWTDAVRMTGATAE
jgi:tripartite-type tricarboxylate transporter receptor subunit TctC